MSKGSKPQTPNYGAASSSPYQQPSWATGGSQQPFQKMPGYQQRPAQMPSRSGGFDIGTGGSGGQLNAGPAELARLLSMTPNRTPAYGGGQPMGGGMGAPAYGMAQIPGQMQPMQQPAYQPMQQPAPQFSAPNYAPMNPMNPMNQPMFNSPRTQGQAFDVGTGGSGGPGLTDQQRALLFSAPSRGAMQSPINVTGLGGQAPKR